MKMRFSVFGILSALFVSVLGIIFFSSHASAQKVPDIRNIPRFSADLPAGTIAWATIDQLHPTQPETGKREVSRKEEKFEELQRNNTDKFPQDLYEELYAGELIPVYTGQTPKYDSRYGKEDALAYLVDSTHGADAMSMLIKKTYGKTAYHKVYYDSKDRPLNFVLVKIIANKKKLSVPQFENFMTEHKHCLLKEWYRGRQGSTEIRDIKFKDLPETVYETTDNPYRSVVGDLQHQHVLKRSKVLYSQFKTALKIKNAGVVTWDDIDLDVSLSDYNLAVKTCAQIFKK